MNQDPVADPADRPMMPPEPDSGMGALRWVITGIAAVLLVVGAWRAYEWFIDDVAKRRAVAEGAAPALQAPPDTQAPPEPGMPAMPPPRTVQPPAPQPAAPAGPSVAGLEGVNKCVVDGQVTYTNAACPPGATPEPPNVAQTDVTGTHAPAAPGPDGDPGAVQVPRPAAFSASGDDPSQRTSMCGYWLAEIERLDFEFQQPLPPPVLDQISTHLGNLREQFAQAKCGPPPKPRADAAKAAAKAAPARPARVVEERSSD